MSAPVGPPAVLVLVTAPSEESARTLAHELVGAGLAACVNVLGGVHSVYRWQDQVEEAGEYLLLIKCPASGYAAVEAWVLAHHPYDVPECVAIPITAGSAHYLAWLHASVGPES